MASALNSVTTYEIISAGTTLSAGETDTEQPSCLPGDIATGGGFFTTLTDPFDEQPRYILRSTGTPLSSTIPPTSWIVTVHNPGPLSLSFNGYVVCLDITPSPPV